MELAIYFESLGVLTVEQVPEYSFGDIVGRGIFSHFLFRIIDCFFHETKLWFDNFVRSMSLKQTKQTPHPKNMPK
jgi:hypothetical protein